jgi:hypothetical protein
VGSGSDGGDCHRLPMRTMKQASGFPKDEPDSYGAASPTRRRGGVCRTAAYGWSSWSWPEGRGAPTVMGTGSICGSVAESS